ncbi:MAG: WG repeat-containing protein, partial [Alphaproteobacteria bacterium]|nr:WG repeat-containing protein [Alphaproteobacteria bacterium]
KNSKTLELSCAELNAKLSALDTEINAIKLEKESITKENTAFKETAQRDKDIISVLSMKNEELETRKSSSENDILELQKQVSNAKQQIQKLESELQSEKDSNSKLTDEITQLNSIENDNKSKLDNQNSEIVSLRDQIEALIKKKEEIAPYLYLIEAKKEQEAAELALSQAKGQLVEYINSANSLIAEIAHQEVKDYLVAQIQISSVILDSESCTIEEINNSIANIQSAITDAKEQEDKLLQSEVAAANEEKEEDEEDGEDDNEEEYEEEEKAEEEEDDEGETVETDLDETEIGLESVEQEETTQAEETTTHVVKRSILEIFDTKEGDIIEAESFFQRPEHELIRWRRIFEESILTGEHRFICPYCRQDVKISGKKYARGLVSYFSHLHDSDYCEIKTTTGLSKEQIEARKYGLVAESYRHKSLKRKIREALQGNASQEKGVSDVVEEKRVSSNLPYMNWRRPDVMAKYNGMNLVFELQLSTTFISVVVQRDIFYRLNNYFIIWVFNFDDNQKYVDLTNLMCKDIYYANKRNIFIFDIEAQNESVKRNELVLKCNWLDVDNTWHFSKSKGNGDGKLITLDELKYDQDFSKPYYFDAETPYFELHPEVREQLQKEERSKQQMIEALSTRAAREEEEAIVRRDNAIKSIVEDNGRVMPFKEGNRYGFKYKNAVVVPAKYTSYSDFDDTGIYKVSFNRHYGLIDRYGNELFECKYLDFHRLSNGLIVAEEKTGFYIAGIGFICERSPRDEVSLKELTSEVSVLEHNSYRLGIFIIDDEYIFSKIGGRYVFSLMSGERVNNHSYSEYYFAKEYSALWLKDSQNGKWQIAELDGTAKNESEYDTCVFGEVYTFASWVGHTDIYTPTGTIIKRTCYDNIKQYGNNYLTFKDNHCGMADSEFNEILAAKYDSIYKDYEFYVVKNNNKFGLFNKEGTELLDTKYDKIEVFYNNVNCSVLISDKRHIVFLPDDYIDPTPYDYIKLIDENHLIVQSDELFGLMDTHGKTCIPAQYSRIELIKKTGENEYLKSLFKCKKNDKYGAYSIVENKYLINDEYDDIECWHENVYKIKLDDKWGLFEVGKGLITDIKYDVISSYNDTKTEVILNSIQGHISPNGQEIISDCQDFGDGYETKQFFSKWALFKNSEMIIPYEYDSPIISLGHSLFKIEIGDKYGVVDSGNNLVLPADYRDIIGAKDTPFLIAKVIKTKKNYERVCGRYGWYTETNYTEYNEYQLFNIDGTQNGIPQQFCGTYSEMAFDIRGLVWVNKHILSTDNWVITEDTFSSIE